MEQKKSRQMNFELLRIISMFVIVVFHYHDWGGIVNMAGSLKNKLFGELIAIGGNLGVNLFVLISGYFLVNSKFKTKKLLKIIFEVWVYSVAIFFISWKFEFMNLGSSDLNKAILPLTNNMYWFATTYVGMYLVFPIINKLISNINRKQYNVILVLLGIMLAVIPTFVIGTRPFNGELAWFIYLYLIAGYIRKYDISVKENKGLIFIILSIVVLMMLHSIGCTLKGIAMSEVLHLNQKNSLFTLALSIAIFMLFKNINIKENKVIDVFSKATFGVYLIHINAHFRVYLFKNILKIQNYYDANFLILVGYVLATSIVIYIMCTIIDTVRRKVIEEPIFKIKIFDKYFEKIDKMMDFSDKTEIKLLHEQKELQNV